MTARRPTFSSALLAALLAALPLAAQQAAAPAPQPLRLHIVGASLSGGFRDGPAFGAKEQGDSLPLQQLLRKWAAERARVTAHDPVTMLAMFTDPQKLGADQIRVAKKQKPDLLLALDFPFWFAYGYVGGEEREARRARYAAGLALLEEVGAPVVLADLPDMTGAASRMLNPRQIPSPPVLQQLREDLQAWAKARPNVRVLPLAQLVQTMKVDGAVLPLASGPLRTAPGALLQEDRLHATRLGMALLGHELQAVVRDLLPKDHPLAAPWTFEQWVEAAGAADDLQAQRERAQPAPAGAGTSK